MQAQLIALDWGTSSLRAYKLGPAGVVLEQRSLGWGIMHLPSEPRDIAGVRCSNGFELAFDAEYIGVVLPWLVINRNGLVVFLHPDTGDDLKDHTDYAIWMGAMRELDLSIF